MSLFASRRSPVSGPQSPVSCLLFRLCLSALLLACTTTGEREVPFSAYAAGRAAESIRTGEYVITLTAARVGLGPLYFCATEAASSDLCPTARAELLVPLTVDALDPTPQPFAGGYALTGAIRSAAFDFARTWLDTQHEPTPAEGAPGGHAAHFEATVASATTSFRVVVDLDLDPQLQGEHAVQGARTMVDVGASGVRLDVALDPMAWWAQVDPAELAEAAAAGAEPVVVGKGFRAWNALVLAMTAQLPPTFSWRTP